MRAMILAAGRGERLRPYTDGCPKPMLEVAGKPLIFWHLEKLAAAGVKEVVINTAWQKEVLTAAIGDGEAWGLSVAWSHEQPGGLETAGGIVEALPLLGEQPFWVINGDVFCDYDFRRLPPLGEGFLGHLVLVSNPEHNPSGDFVLGARQRVQLKHENDANTLTFSGISVLSPILFKGLERGKRALRPVFEKAILQSALSGEHYSGYWSDVGTPERLLQANQQSAGL